MTRASFRILTKVGNSHRESEVFINWEGISEADLKILATAAIKHNIQAMLRKQWQSGDEKIFVTAKDAVNNPQASRFTDLDFLNKLDRTPEDRMERKPGSKSVVDPITALLDGMSPEQKKEILAMLM